MSCNKKMTFEECELAILRTVVDKIGKQEGAKLLNDPEVKRIIEIVEDFLRKKKLVCYGGTAINALLDPADQFYDTSVELPDYDFFSPTPLNDAKELADIYHKGGFTNVEAKAGIHIGTYKVFVNYLPVADITAVIPDLFKTIKKTSISRDGILYSSPDYLRMLMYLELSRPRGDISRWEKVLKRISLLNKKYPLKGKGCEFIEIQRLFEKKSTKKLGRENIENIFNIVRDTLINQGVIFFGAMAMQLYLKKLKKFSNHTFKKIPDFDVLSIDPNKTAEILKEELVRNGYKKIKIIKHDGIGEIIAHHVEVSVNNETLVLIYEPVACHSYNEIKLQQKKIKIGTIDTILSFYLAFTHANKKYYDSNRLLCLAEYLFTIQKKNRLKQYGLLKRFSIKCYGKQETLELMRKEKSELFEKLKHKRYGKEWERYFLKYIPGTKKGSFKSAKVNTWGTRKKTKITKRKAEKRKATKKSNFGSRVKNAINNILKGVKI
jgi:hypothetical protein